LWYFKPIVVSAIVRSSPFGVSPKSLAVAGYP
jgi:hypothetical protein